MRDSLNIYEQIDNYLSNNMSVEELNSFKNQLKNDAELQRMVDSQQLLIQAQQRKILRAEINAIANSGGFPYGKVLGGIGLVIVSIAMYLIIGSKPIEANKAEMTQNIEKTTKIDPIIENLEENPPKDSLSDEKVVDSTTSLNTKSSISSKKSDYTYKEDTECGGHTTWVAPDVQKFTVNPSKGTTIEGKEGMLIIVPKDAFVDEKGNLIKTPVALELVEALTLEDMVLYNLATVSNGKLLESGGMFYLDAKSNGKSVKINPERPFYIEIPTNEAKKGMMAFEGEVDEAGNLNWVNPKPLKKYLAKMDFAQLDFLPKGFESGVEAGLPFRNHKIATKELVDSLYYSISNVGEIKENTIARAMNNGRPQAFLESRLPKGDRVVEGHVKYQNNKGVYDAIVYLGNKNGTSFVKSQGNNGQYKFLDIPVGSYRLNVVVPKPRSGTKAEFEIVHSSNVLVKNTSVVVLDDIVIENALNGGRNMMLSETATINLNKLSNQEDCGINPLSIKTIKTNNFANTFVATKEFEERIAALHEIDNGQELLDVYLDNLGKDLYVSDSIVASKLKGSQKVTFEAFYNHKLTNLEDANIHQEQLSTYYNKKRKKYAVNERKLRNKLLRKDREGIQKLVSQVELAKKQYNERLTANASPAIRYASNKTNNASTVQSYGFTWNAIGWCNIDGYMYLLENGSIAVNIKLDNVGVNTQIYQWLNEINTLIPLNIMNNEASAKFPKKGSLLVEQNRNTFCFAISKSKGGFKWCQNNFDPYKTNSIVSNLQNISLQEIKHKLKLLDVRHNRVLKNLDRLERTLVEIQLQRKNRKAIDKKVDVATEKYLSSLQVLENKIEAINTRRIKENIFIESLMDIAFPCREGHVGQGANDSEENPVLVTYVTPEIPPSFIGGQEGMYAYLTENIVYPETVKNAGIGGKVYAQFVVKEDGSIGDVLVVKKVHPLLDAEAVRVIQNMPKWNPGTVDGKITATKFTLPIVFKPE